MSGARLIDGKRVAAALREDVARRAAALETPPALAVVLVGDDPASRVYVRTKTRALAEAGMTGTEHRLPGDTGEAALLALIGRLNDDPAIDGILMQLPLPAHIDTARVVAAVDPAKDVDGFNPVNAGRLAAGAPGPVPCTPQGAMHLLAHAGIALEGAEALVIGRSAIVGKPMALLLLAANATVTLAHSRTRDLAAVCRRADVVVAAAGRPEMVRGSWLKPGAAVIDVGINRVAAPGGGKPRLVGDVAFDEARAVAGAITPVPGGVGPMTVACLLANTLRAASARRAAPRAG